MAADGTLAGGVGTTADIVGSFGPAAGSLGAAVATIVAGFTRLVLGMLTYLPCFCTSFLLHIIFAHSVSTFLAAGTDLVA